MENYNKTLRQKKELEKKLGQYNREYRAQITLLNIERDSLEGGLLDLQSKTSNLRETVQNITRALKDDLLRSQNELAELEKKKTHIYNRGRRSIAIKAHEANMAALAKQEAEIIRKIEVDKRKLEWITGQRQSPEVTKTTNVITMIGANKGFKAILNRIRTNKESIETLPQLNEAQCTLPLKPDFNKAKTICDLIDEFHKLPKVYESKPRKKLPDRNKVLIEQYEDRKKKRELAMNYGTRVRMRRAEYFCSSLTHLYLPSKTGTLSQYDKSVGPFLPAMRQS